MHQSILFHYQRIVFTHTKLKVTAFVTSTGCPKSLNVILIDTKWINKEAKVNCNLSSESQ